MGLVDLDDVASLLCCPRCRVPLVGTSPSYRCTSSSCGLATATGFRAVARWPVLVDFEASVLRCGELTALAGGDSALLPAARPPATDRLPRWLRSWWKPTNRVARRNIEHLLRLLPGPSPLVLVVGGGTEGNGVEAIYRDVRLRVLGFDIYGSPLTQFIADGQNIPLVDESVDAVIVQAVLEHVLNPALVVSEVRRVLRSGGLVYAETPFLQQVHAGPYDFTRYTSSGHRHLFRAFEELDAGAVSGPGTVALWTVDHLTRGVLRSELAGKLARAIFFWLRYLDAIVPSGYAMDSAAAYYFLGRRSNRELTAHDMISYYRGMQGS